MIRRSAAALLPAALPAAGTLVAFAASVVVAVLTLLSVPLRVEIGGSLLRIPAAVVIAAAGNWLLVRYAPRVIGWRWSVLAPVAGWFMVTLPALGVTASGDRLLMPNDIMGTLALFSGTIVLTIGTILAVFPARHPPADRFPGPTRELRPPPTTGRPFMMTDHEDSSS